VYASKSVGVLQTEGLVAIFALISLWIVFKMRPKFEQINQAGEPEAVAG
jgi:hypothetical protein